jgi:hypothetical protein
MNLSLRKSLLALSLCISIAPLSIQAQHVDANSQQSRSNYIPVSAPLAQAIILRVKAHHDDIVKLGLHAIPPGDTDNAIIANITPSKIGKKSSAKDLENLAENKPVAARLDKSHTFDLLIPITDRNGGDLGGGFVVMEVPYSKAANEKQAIKIGVRIRNEIQRQIPSRAALYQQ